MTKRSSRTRRPRRIGLLGGTFDPPHLGHLLLAEAAKDALALDRVLFVPARTPPHKKDGRITPAPTRLRLLEAALSGTGFSICALELSRPGPSYTVDTLNELRERAKTALFYWLIGEDNLDELRTWRNPAKILELATLVVGRRPGAAAGAGLPRGTKDRIVFLDNPPVSIASRDLRARVASGQSIRFLVPAAVERLVKTLGLYRS